MTSEMSSIIRFYQGSSTANSSNRALNSPSPPLYQAGTSSAQQDTPSQAPNSILLKKIDPLPTPLSSGALGGFNTGNNLTPRSKAVPNSTSVSITSSFLSIPLRLFSLGKIAPKSSFARETEIVSVSGPPSPALQDETPIDVITDSPIENLLPDDAGIIGSDINVVLNEEEHTEDLDPIFETYVRFVYHQQEFNSDEEEGSGFPPLDENLVSDSATIVDEANVNAVRAQPAIDYDVVPRINLDANEEEVLPQADGPLPRTSTLSRIKSRTKGLLRQLSLHYENEKKIFNENSLKAKTELKRKLSNVSLRRNTSQRWRWSRRNNSLNNQNIFGNSVGSENENIDSGQDDYKGRSLMELFQSPNFTQRLEEGVLNERKAYNNYENGEQTNDENYHISYKLNNVDPEYLTKKHYFGPKRARSFQNFAKTLFTSRSLNQSVTRA